MSKNCAKCGKELGLLSTKHESEDGSIMCNSCFEKWKNEQAKEKEKTINEFLSKYITDKDATFRARIIFLNQNKDGEIGEQWDDYSLNRLREFYQNMLDSVESQKRGRLSSYEMDELIDTKEVAEGVLEFLDDLERLFKLFEKKEMETNYSEILSCLSNIIENELNKGMENEVITPVYKRISKRLGDKISKEAVIREFMKTPLDIDYIEDINNPFSLTCKLLDKFNFEYNRKEVEQLMKKIQEEVELEDFEQNLGSQKKTIELGDFSTLNGYEFEAYLKDMFDHLGYTVVETPLSGDQGADLILSKDEEKIVVQAKKYDGKVSNNAIQEIVAAKNHYNADKAMVVTNSSFTPNAIELALSNNVELWDGEKLQDKIKSLESKRKEKGFSATKESTINREKDIQQIKAFCPVCEEKFDYEITADEIEAGGFETVCPHCGASIKAGEVGS